MAKIAKTADRKKEMDTTKSTGPSVADETHALPAAVRLSEAYPNPAKGRAAFSLDLPKAARVEWAIFDVQGREVWGEKSRTCEAGTWALAWNGELERRPETQT